MKFLNLYKCPCGEEWEDLWDCACNDKCPQCNKEIEPYYSEEINTTDANADISKYGYDFHTADALGIALSCASGEFFSSIKGKEKCLKLAAEGNEVAKQVLAERMRRAMGVYPRIYDSE